MKYKLPTRRVRFNESYEKDGYFIIKVKGKEFIFDLSNKEILKKFYWNTRGTGYLYTATLHDTSIAVHRLLLNIPQGSKKIIDHINGNILDNRLCNIRITNRAGNMMNICDPQGSNAFRGVHWNKNRKTWAAFISYRKKGIRVRIHGGVFHNLNEAIKRRIELEKQYFQKFCPQR